MERLELLERLVTSYEKAADDASDPETRAHFEQRCGEVRTELAGERGARGLNPMTGAAK